MGASPLRASSNDQRFALTLRGLRYLDHRKNSPKLIGTVVPWSRTYVFRGGHAFSVVVVGEDGRPLGTRWRPTCWPVPISQHAAVRWAIERWQKRATAERSFDVRETYVERSGVRWCAAVLVVLQLVALGLTVSMAVPQLRGLGGLPLAVQIGTILAALVMPGWVLFNGGLVWYMWIERATANVRSIRLLPDRIEAELFNGQAEVVPLADIRHIRRRLSGLFRIDTCSGMRLTAFSQIGVFVLKEWMQRISPAPQPPTTRQLVVRAFWWCQAGGVIAATLIWSLNIPSPHSPFVTYLLVGFVVPAGLALAASLEPISEFVSTRWRKWRRRRACGCRLPVRQDN